MVPIPPLFEEVGSFKISNQPIVKAQGLVLVGVVDSFWIFLWPRTPLNLLVLYLVVRIARPTSLAIWHRGCSHRMFSQRRPNRNGSPNRRHFASLDLKEHPDFLHRKPTSQDIRSFFPGISCAFRSSECVFASLAKNLFRIGASLAIWGCAIRIASHIAVASRDLGH